MFKVYEKEVIARVVADVMDEMADQVEKRARVSRAMQKRKRASAERLARDLRTLRRQHKEKHSTKKGREWGERMLMRWKMKKASVKIQAVVRGHQARKAAEARAGPVRNQSPPHKQGHLQKQGPIERSRGSLQLQVAVLVMWLAISFIFFPIAFLTISSTPTCLRGDAIRPGDTPLAPGQCIEGATGSRWFGWLPFVSWKARLSVTHDGNMVALRPNGVQVLLTDVDDQERAGGMLCGAQRAIHALTSRPEPDYGARSAGGQLVLGKEYFCSVFAVPAARGLGEKMGGMIRRGGHVGFSSDGDLEVRTSRGKRVWSLADQLADPAADVARNDEKNMKEKKNEKKAPEAGAGRQEGRRQKSWGGREARDDRAKDDGGNGGGGGREGSRSGGRGAAGGRQASASSNGSASAPAAEEEQRWSWPFRGKE